MEKIDKAIEILQAFKEGKTIECRYVGNGEWFKINVLPLHTDKK